MKINHVAFAEERIIELETLSRAQIEDGSPVRLRLDSVGATIHHQSYGVACLHPDAVDRDWLEMVVSSGYLAELVSTRQESKSRATRAILRILRFDGLELWPDGRQLGVDDTTVDDVRRHRGQTDSVEAVVSWLQDELAVADTPAAVITAGIGAPDSDAFRVVGATICADVRLLDDRLMIHRITARRSGDEKLILARGAVSVVDATRQGTISAADRQEIRRLSEADNAYLAIWDEYNELERDAARAAAQEIGWADYDRFHVRPDGTLEFELVQSTRSDQLREQLARTTVGLEAGAGVAFVDDDVRADVIGDAWLTPSGAVRLRPSSLYDGSLPRRGSLAGAYTLDRVRISRRQAARERVSRGETTPARQLGLVLGDLRPDPVGRVRRHEPLSDRARSLLGGAPTEAQVRAIDLAINSRDVVLIQGPPGTGKTRVIAAIQARLTEIHADASSLSRRVLLTSYQHDAVSNLVLAADDGALPAVKLGREQGAEDDGHLIAWTNDLQRRLDQRYLGVAPHHTVRARRTLDDRTSAYLEQHFDVGSTVELLEWLTAQFELVGVAVSDDAKKLARQLRKDLGTGAAPKAQVEVAMRARRLRTTPEGYADDGRLTATAAFTSQPVFDSLSDAERRSLESAARGLDPHVAAPQLQQVQQVLLDRTLNARARASFVATMPVVEALLERARNAADRQVELTTTPLQRAVARFRDAVETQPSSVRQSVERHTRALAATCQQAASTAIRAAQPVAFDTVIVDEAARANPLDLMVPLSLAKERIVLVGDHRQLPQLLDNSLVPHLAKRHNSDVMSAVLSRSMFERLFVKLDEVGRADGVTRVITLDQQFRMHPVLGDFVSAQFYAPFGERLRNGVPDPTKFKHSLDHYGPAAAGWIDVPRSAGPEEPIGPSIARRAEADVIVRELAQSLEATTDTTFGVITFYSGQVAAIWEAMVAAGMATREGATFALNRSLAWLFDGRGLPRLRIGSVDAFQGREFDVVYLSTTRSSTPSRRRNRFGFLALPNRLCVAMSRQRRLLIAVGDAGQFTSPDGREAVPALAAFHDLTGGGHGFRRTA